MIAKTFVQPGNSGIIRIERTVAILRSVQSQAGFVAEQAGRGLGGSATAAVAPRSLSPRAVRRQCPTCCRSISWRYSLA